MNTTRLELWKSTTYNMRYDLFAETVQTSEHTAIKVHNYIFTHDKMMNQNPTYF